MTKSSPGAWDHAKAMPASFHEDPSIAILVKCFTKNCHTQLIMVRAGVSPELVFSGPPELIMVRAGVSPELGF